MQELPDNPSWLLKQAIRSCREEHYTLARLLCWVELRRKPNDYFALCWYANSLYFSGRHNDRRAASVYERAIEINPVHPLAHAGLGRIHHSNVLRIHEDYKIFPGGEFLMFMGEKSPKKSPEDSGDKNIISLTIPSYADSQVGNRRIAIAELEEAANLASDRDDKVQLLDMAAQIHCIIGGSSYEDAIRAYKKILHIAPNYIPAHFHLAGCYAATYYLHKQSPPTSYYGEHFSDNDKLALKEYKFIKENAPELASALETVLANFDIHICK